MHRFSDKSSALDLTPSVMRKSLDDPPLTTKSIESMRAGGLAGGVYPPLGGDIHRPRAGALFGFALPKIQQKRQGVLCIHYRAAKTPSRALFARLRGMRGTGRNPGCGIGSSDQGRDMSHQPGQEIFNPVRVGLQFWDAWDGCFQLRQRTGMPFGTLGTGVLNPRATPAHGLLYAFAGCTTLCHADISLCHRDTRGGATCRTVDGASELTR
jgi:hypothetical protein